MMERELIFLEKCKKLTDVLKDTIDIYYPNGLECGVIVNVFVMILAQTFASEDLSDEDAFQIFKDNYLFFKSQMTDERRTP